MATSRTINAVGVGRAGVSKVNGDQLLGKEIDLLYELQPIDEMVSAVYFLFYEPELVYVGQSLGVSNRMNYHFRNRSYARGVPWTFWGAMAVPKDRLNEVEYHYIQRFKPCGNKQMAPRY